MQLKSTGRHLKRYRKKVLKRYSFSSKLIDLSFVLNKLLNMTKYSLNNDYNLFKKYIKLEFLKKISYLDNYFVNSSIFDKKNFNILLISLFEISYKNTVLNNFFLIIKKSINYIYYYSNRVKFNSGDLTFYNLNYNKFYFKFILELFLKQYLVNFFNLNKFFRKQFFI